MFGHYVEGDDGLAFHLHGRIGPCRQGRLGAAQRQLRSDAGVARAELVGAVDAVDAVQGHLRIHFARWAQHGVGIAHVTVIGNHEDGQTHAANAHTEAVRHLGLGEGPRQFSAEIILAILARQSLHGGREPRIDGDIGLQTQVGIDARAGSAARAGSLVRTRKLRLVRIGHGQRGRAVTADLDGGTTGLVGVGVADGQGHGQQENQDVFIHSNQIPVAVNINRGVDSRSTAHRP